MKFVYDQWSSLGTATSEAPKMEDNNKDNMVSGQYANLKAGKANPMLV